MARPIARVSSVHPSSVKTLARQWEQVASRSLTTLLRGITSLSGTGMPPSQGVVHFLTRHALTLRSSQLDPAKQVPVHLGQLAQPTPRTSPVITM